MSARLALLAALVALAGCVTPSPAQPSPLPLPDTGAGGVLSFTTTMIDAVRAGGEPVIQITPKGTLLVASHPGWTHTRYPPSPNLVTPASGQSYMWRSTDQGQTWTPLGLPMVPGGVGPRGLGQGVSDPDFAIDSKGRVYFTDLEALAAASVSWSDDDGATWIMGNDIASTYGPIDRNWLATHGTDVYFMGNYFAAERVLKSVDGGLTWTQVGESHCGGDISTRDESQGGFALLVGCGAGIDVSEDDGRTFERRDVPGAKASSRGMTEPAVDAAGNVYIAWTENETVKLAGTPDLGLTWTAPVDVGAALPAGELGTSIWPWVVAGDAGRVAVVWYATSAPGGPAQAKGDWLVYQATVLDAMGPAPQVVAAKVTPEPIFRGGICQAGTTCQADISEEGDRRLGDFFEAAVDAQGYLNIAYAVVGADSISHPGFARQTGGPSLLQTTLK